MKKFFAHFLAFNHNINYLASKDNFTSAGIVGLSIASWVTTFLGMLSYTDLWIIAFLASLGFQFLMLFSAVRYASLLDRTTMKAQALLLLFFAAMSVSSFFSFAAFHQVMEPPERRLEEADALLRNEWTDVYTYIRRQALGEFGEKVNRGSADGTSEYQKWVDSVAEMKASSVRYVTEMRQALSKKQADLSASPDAIRFAQLEEQRKGIEARRSELDIGLGPLERSVRDAQRREVEVRAKLEQELGEGGTVLADGTITRPGEGPISRRLRADLARIRSELTPLERELDVRRSDIERVNNELRDKAGTIAAFANESELARQLTVANTAREQVDGLEVTVSGLRIPAPVVGAGNAQALMDTADVIKQTTVLCQTIRAQYDSTAAAVAAAGVTLVGGPGGARSNGGAVGGNRCDVAPIYGSGITIPDHVEQMRPFLLNCEPNKLESRDVVLARDESKGTRQQVNPYLNFSEAGLTAAERDYARYFRYLQGQFNSCLAVAPEIGSGEALKQIRERFATLTQEYNPRAHPFTRAVSAFSRGDLTATFAATVAVLIDLLIFIAGLAMQRDRTNGRDVAGEAEKERQAEINAFIIQHREAAERVCDAIQYAELAPEVVDGEMREVHVLSLDSPGFETIRPELRLMNNLGLLNIEGDRVLIMRDKAEYLFDLVGRGYGEA